MKGQSAVVLSQGLKTSEVSEALLNGKEKNELIEREKECESTFKDNHISLLSPVPTALNSHSISSDKVIEKGDVLETQSTDLAIIDSPPLTNNLGSCSFINEVKKSGDILELEEERSEFNASILFGKR